jgi:hypothetical protein
MEGLGTADGQERRPLFRPIAALAVAFGLFAVVTSVTRPIYRLGGYPVRAVTWMDREGLVRAGGHVVAPDFVGNYLEARYGPAGMVFVDDRYDMFPAELVEDYVVLNDGLPGWQAVLRRHQPDVLVWQLEEPLGQLVTTSTDWSVLYADDDWIVAVPRVSGSGP